MAAQPKTWDDKLFEGLSPHGKEFMLPNVFNPWLVEEFVLTPHLRLKAYPTRTCDDYFLYKTLTNPSVPLVASVEKFFLGDNDNPLSYNDGEGCGLQLDRECDIESGSFPGSGHLENVQSYVNASRADLPISSNHLEPSSVDEH